jgi:lipopolysaccharide/colanic/teichoic acid biosynthesis glycosyltransferase
VSAATARRLFTQGDAATALGPSLTPSTLRFQAYKAMAPVQKRTGELARRSLNVVVALVGIVLTAPLMLVIAALIKASSRGPVFYSQPRVGLDRRGRSPAGATHRRRSDRGGKIFTIYKFRTMRPAAPGAKQVWAGENDPRITTVGRFLRRTRLDELPQLFNVLKGDMNIVGPRPEQPTIFQDLQGQLGTYRARQRVLPGITGLAQVSVGYDASVEDVKKKVAKDLEYVRSRSAMNDLVIMAKTMPVMVLRQGSR